MKLFLLMLVFLLFAFNLKAADNLELSINELTVLIELDKTLENQENKQLILNVSAENKTVKFKRGKAILFTLLTGPFGGHRIYLGTHHRTPIIYSITLGGLFILPLVDLVNIIFTKDLSKFDNKTQIIMWGN